MPDNITDKITTLLQQERAAYLQAHPASGQLAEASAGHFLFGVPLHWMRDWPNPATLFVSSAQGIELRCADQHRYADFCLGDTGAMFGHSPPVLAQALAAQAAMGLTTMLPSTETAAVGRLLAESFGLPQWQLTLSASDANRFVLRGPGP